MIFMVDLQSYGYIRVKGEDAASFLQGQLTCDVHTLNSTHLSLGAYCNLKGRVMILFKLFLIGSDYYLQCPLDLIDKAISKLKAHAMFSKVQIENLSSEWKTLGIIGETIEPVISCDPHLTQNLIIRKAPTTANKEKSRWQLIGSPNTITSLWEILRQTPHISLKMPEYWTLLDIRAGIPEITTSTSEQFLAHHLNLPELNAISFNKGCYHGQEIIARMQYRATLKKHMVHKIGYIEPQDIENIVLSSTNEQGLQEHLIIVHK